MEQSIALSTKFYQKAVRSVMRAMHRKSGQTSSISSPSRTPCMLAVDLRPDVHSLRGPLDDDNVSAKFMVNASITPSFPFKCLAALRL